MCDSCWGVGCPTGRRRLSDVKIELWRLTYFSANTRIRLIRLLALCTLKCLACQNWPAYSCVLSHSLSSLRGSTCVPRTCAHARALVKLDEEVSVCRCCTIGRCNWYKLLKASSGTFVTSQVRNRCNSSMTNTDLRLFGRALTVRIISVRTLLTFL